MQEQEKVSLAGEVESVGVEDGDMKTFSVRFISATPDAEKTMLYTARVSSPNQESTNTQLLSYCIRNGHWSVFEMSMMLVEVVTSRAISAQIIRHRFSFQEFSQRYAKAMGTIEYPARRQDQKNRQNSIDDMSEEDKRWFSEAQNEIASRSAELYQQALDRGIAKECARFLLPMSSRTKLYMNGKGASSPPLDPLAFWGGGL